ncbi:MAG: hypothetical protein CFE26_22005 [Verrucomicrobiales bacterium VVV1]|nr:MAG: hypothetical protein CFE26_22005 [Verrucomicrobiales bacterium VVV1]
MRRRGEAVSPMLLKLLSENTENIVEFAILGKIGYLDTVDIGPFLDYARKLLRERTQTMSGEAAGAAAYILARHGTKEDEAQFEEIIRVRPSVKYTITEELKILRARLDLKPEIVPGPRPDQRELPSSSTGNAVRPDNLTQNHQQDGSEDTFWIKPWFIVGMILAVLLGLYRHLRKGLRGNSA